VQKREQHITYYQYDSIEELPVEEQKLLMKAVAAIDNAYAPYSHFRVGAAVLLENGKIVTGIIKKMQLIPRECVQNVLRFGMQPHNIPA
jgi:hypothetical protein